MQYGIELPNQIDRCAIIDDVCVFSIIQNDIIDESNIVLLQDKLNNYLTYILDGQLQEDDINKLFLPKKIELVIRFTPSDFLRMFITHMVPILEEEGIEFLLRIE